MSAPALRPPTSGSPSASRSAPPSGQRHSIPPGMTEGSPGSARRAVAYPSNILSPPLVQRETSLVRVRPKKADFLAASARIIDDGICSKQFDPSAGLAMNFRKNPGRQYTRLPCYSDSGNPRRPTQAASRRACSAARRWSRASRHKLCTNTVQVTARSRCAKPLLSDRPPRKTFLSIPMRPSV